MNKYVDLSNQVSEMRGREKGVAQLAEAVISSIRDSDDESRRLHILREQSESNGRAGRAARSDLNGGRKT